MSSDGSDLRHRYAEALANAECEKRPRCVHCMADAVMAVRDEELAKLREERELAIAHDRQPYPTAWAYEQACKALNEWRERAETAERDREQQRLAYNAANAMAGVHKLRADRLKAELEHAKGALAGDSEAMAAFMADHAKVVERLREQNRIAHRAAEQAEAALDRVHALAEHWSHEPHPTHDHPCPDDLRRELLAALDSQSPTLEPETPAGEEADDAAPRP